MTVLIDGKLEDPLIKGKKVSLLGGVICGQKISMGSVSEGSSCSMESFPKSGISSTLKKAHVQQLHIELDAFNIWSLRLRKLIEEKRLNAQALTASKETILVTTTQLAFNLSSDQIMSTKLEGSQESLLSSQASPTTSLAHRPTILHPVNCLASSPAVSHSCMINNSGLKINNNNNNKKKINKKKDSKNNKKKKKNNKK
ncbi:hypothetical protein BY996DRAFT_6594253 [Phakopsora pachyrhizi]|nr:hypothetical protein BY996DRAFT_6594253 [Phakopsora pachyrhizi]